MYAQPAVSVIIPAFNVETYLSEALESVCSQTLRDVEILIIDDGSTDDTAALAKAWQVRDKRLRLLRQRNQGAGYSRNQGIAQAKGKFVFFLDADDKLAAPNVLERLYRCVLAANVHISGGGLVEEKNGIRSPHVEKWMRFEEASKVKYSDYQYDYGYTRFLYNTEFLRQNELHFPRLRRYQDPPFFVRAMHAAQFFYALPMTVYSVRMREDHVTWNADTVCDLLEGIVMVAMFARENSYKALQKREIMRVFVDYRDCIIKAACSEDERVRVLAKLCEFASLADFNVLANGSFSTYMLANFGFSMADILSLYSTPDTNKDTFSKTISINTGYSDDPGSLTHR